MKIMLGVFYTKINAVSRNGQIGGPYQRCSSQRRGMQTAVRVLCLMHRGFDENERHFM